MEKDSQSSEGKVESGLSIRRSIPSDVQDLAPLIERIEPLLMSRYGRKDLNILLEEAVLSFTVLEDNKPVSVACFSFPPSSVYYDYRQLLLIFFAAEMQTGPEAARLIMETTFDTQPCIETILTNHIEFSPNENYLNSLFIEESDKFYISKREVIVPPLLVRAARVEDYDDLMPLFTSEAPDLIQQYGKFFVSDLIKANETKCLVAEGGEMHRAVAFIGLEPDFDPSPHKEAYDLSAFQDLFQEKGIAFRIRLFFIAEEYKSHARDFIKPIFALMSKSDYCLMFLPTNSPPFPLSPFFTRIPAVDHGIERFVLYLCHRDSVLNVLLSVRKFSLQDDRTLLENFIETLSNRKEILSRINGSPIEDENPIINASEMHESISEEPADDANSVHSAKSDKTESGEKNDNESDEKGEEKGSEQGEEEISPNDKQDSEEHVQKGVVPPTGITSQPKESDLPKQEWGDPEESIYLLMANEIIAGFAIFAPPKPIDHQKWDIEEYVEIKACSKHCEMQVFSISPIFQRFSAFFLARCMEIQQSHALYILYRGGGYFPDLLGTLFLAIERRQGPASPVLDKHLQKLETMHLLPRKYILQPKYEINTSIVIVGSTEGVSTLVYKLISTPYLHFSAIHVICTGGAERIWVNTASCREHSPDWLQHLHLLDGVSFFESDLSEIQRDEHQIILDDGRIVAYDFLVLLTAKEGEVADMWMAKTFVENTRPPVSVVGDSLVAYYILSHYPGCAHIAHNPRFKLEGTHATIIKDSTVAYCDFKEVPEKLLAILEKSSLVYDGGIVIDELFRTNDPKIFAAGPITMFSRLYRLKPSENVISQTEYGAQLGAVLLKFVDPIEKFVEPPTIVGSDDAKTLIETKGPDSVPKFTTRRAELYQLPGSRIFFRNGFPSAKCRCLETIKHGQTIRFFIDANGFIQAFEYLGEASGQICKFIGYPAVLLNNMIERYDKKMIVDFAEFFQEPWCAAILHDRFRKFFDNLLEELLRLPDPNSPEAHNQIRQALMSFLIENDDLLPDYYTSESQLPPLDDDE